jgi:hypothetical protein
MRGLDEIYTKKGTPLVAILARAGFAVYFATAFLVVYRGLVATSVLEPIWIVYQGILYLGSEWLYNVFARRGIDLTFAFPLLFAVFCLNLGTLLLGGQEKLPLMNRAEHFASFVLLTYIVWIFFIKYLPQNVWQDHPYYTSLLVLAVTCMLGVGNELIELLFDKVFATRLVGRNYDTSLDLMMNTLGSTLFLAVRAVVGYSTASRQTQ